MNETQSFFQRLCARLTSDERVTLWTLPDRLSQHLPPDPALLAERAIDLDARGGSGVFFGVCPRVSDLGARRRGGLEDVARVQALWIDIDIAHPTHAAKNLPPGTLEAASLLAGVPEPSMVIWSGGGLHAYWLLDEPQTRELGARAVELLQEEVRQAAKLRGWHLDATANPDRVLRVPGTTNRKDPNDPRACSVIDEAGHVYNFQQIVGALGVPASASAPMRTLAPSSSPSTGDAGTSRALTLPGADQRKYAVDFLRTVRSEKSHALAKQIVAGEPFAKGERDSELNRAAGLISWICAAPEYCAEDLVEVLYPSVDATIALDDDPKNPAPTRDDALDKLTRAMKDARKKKARETASRDAMTRGLIRAARASARHSLDEPEDEDVSDRPYTADEIKRFELEHGAPLQWIVQYQGSHYVMVGGRYQGPVVTSDLGVNFRRTLAPAPLDLIKYDNNLSRPMTASEILEEHSTDAARVVADLRLSSSQWDREHRTFHEACAPLRPVRPVYTQQIQDWLELLGGEHPEKLLDWVASVTRLDQQCAALYLSKNTGSGKSMLATGLARLWGSSPTQLKNIVGNWNTDLTRCPLVVADEHLPPSWGRSTTASSELRELVGSSTRTLTRKFLPNVDLVGAIRLVLIANDKSMLPFDESLGTNDMEAIGSRFLHIRTTAESAEYLRSLGGRNGQTRDWVSGDRIAAHALWLRDNRKVMPGARFVVEGHAAGVQEDLVTETRIGSLVCEVIARTLASSRPMAAGGAPAVRAGGGKLLVSTPGVADQWKHCVESDPVQSTQRIGRQLALMSDGVAERVRGVSYYVVRHEYVLRWAERYLVGDVDLMRAKIEGTVLDIHDRGKK